MAYKDEDNNNDLYDRRQHSDRIVRLETVVERLEDDISGLVKTYKELGETHTAMFVEMIKSSTSLQGSIDMLTKTLTPLADKVAEHDKFMYKTIGIITAVVVVINILGWILTH